MSRKQRKRHFPSSKGVWGGGKADSNPAKKQKTIKITVEGRAGEKFAIYEWVWAECHCGKEVRDKERITSAKTWREGAGGSSSD